ncbi:MULTISPECIES: DNA/RNA non-specific endonuclease [Pseudomonas]|uniref:DNA/RNA non-specific endonuclease n=1 Tax=Pseudomonas gingeri TaxID=117681 RepID=A0A7Y7WLZ4_9PSED|nr:MULTISPECIES: DNA/RNA non-specific endonuclease [Pseudomonas]NWB83964.1 DNA/RNA non-specific endonuclease [Pseudomonas gingeri]
MRFVQFLSNPPENFKGGARQRVKRLVAEMSPGVKPHTPTPRNNTVLPLSMYEGGVADTRHEDCHRGHLIALEFGGPESSSNLVPMYGSFNSGGIWRQFERELESWVDAAGGNCEVAITCDYATEISEEQRVPTRFTIITKVLAGLHVNRTRTWPILHPKPAPIIGGADPTKKAEYLALIDEMTNAGWNIQDQLNTVGFPSYRRLPVFPAAARPYAFLDYAEWKSVKDDPKQLAHWNDRVILSQAAEFSSTQIETIRAVNRVLNDGYLISDDIVDPVYTDKYRIPGQRVGLLVEGGHDLTPQVDHIIAKSASGAAVYSNAMLISAKHNSDKRARLAFADSNALSSIVRGTGRVKRYKPY